MNVVLVAFDGGIALRDRVHACLILSSLNNEDFLLLFDLFLNIGYFFLSFFHFLVCTSSGHFGILVVCLKLVVARLELLNLLVTFNIASSLSLLHLGELFEQLAIVSLGHVGIGGHGFVCCRTGYT